MAKNIYVSTVILLAAGIFNVASADERGDEDRYLRQPMPERWSFTQEVSQTLPTEDAWWKSFHDATLDSLIAVGIDNNYNVSQAVHRREMARLAVNQARSAYFPSVGLSAGYTRTQTRHNGTNDFSLGADVNWEVDIFGKITSQVKAKKASYSASRAEYLATMVSITADIATYYINYRVLQNELRVANEHIEYQAKVVNIAEARHEAGLVSKLDVAQAKTVYYSTQATLPSLESRASQTLNALAILLGVYSDELAPVMQRSSALLPYQQIVPAGVPANLLRRRPDIAEAEAQLAGYAAQLGIAKKDFLPTLTLQGTVGWGSDKVDRMFDSNHFSLSVGPKLSWTLFDGFSRKYALAQAKEQMMAGIDAYNLTVMNAYAEVENAMKAYEAATRSIDINAQVLAQSQESFDLAMDQYKQGLAAFTNVVNAQIDWLNCANTLVGNHGDALVALVDIYKALGGSPIE